MISHQSKVLVVGSGGREHAIVRAFKRGKLYCAPGNAGIANDATCPPIAATDVESLVKFARDQKIDLTIVGPDAPLAAGIVDAFRAQKLRIFGPTKAAAQLESSKVFCVNFLRRHQIPAPQSDIFDRPADARTFALRQTGPSVLKADGLCAGKGVIVVANPQEAINGIREIMEERRFGPAGDHLLIQKFLTGRELSLMVITDGESAMPLAPARDYKRAHNGDRGPNTGGMGSYSPVPDFTPKLQRRVMDTIVLPTIRGMAAEGRPYTGVLYFGLMLTPDGPQVLEINCRFGDPEIQVILARLLTPLCDLVEASLGGQLNRCTPRWSSHAAVCVVAAAKGYPAPTDPGASIGRLGDLKPAAPSVQILHAGTKLNQDLYLTAGGRVLNVVATAPTFEAARGLAYDTIRRVNPRSLWWRTDIARGVDLLEDFAV